MEAETRELEGILVTKPQLQKKPSTTDFRNMRPRKRMQIKEAVKPAADKKTNFRGG
jgi:hypothetical protein